MDNAGKRWTVRDREGNFIYLTEERWTHILENHPEVEFYEDHLKTTLEKGKRKQEPLNPRKYRYGMSFRDLPDEYNHIVAIVLFGFVVDVHGETTANNWVATVFMKHIREQGNSR